MESEKDDGRWADWRSTCALTGIEPCDLAWAMARRQVNYSVDRPGHEGVPMILVDDVQRLIRSGSSSSGHQPPELRVVRDVR